MRKRNILFIPYANLSEQEKGDYWFWVIMALLIGVLIGLMVIA